MQRFLLLCTVVLHGASCPEEPQPENEWEQKYGIKVPDGFYIDPCISYEMKHSLLADIDSTTGLLIPSAVTKAQDLNTAPDLGVPEGKPDFAHNPWMFPQTTVYRGEQYCDSGRPLASLPPADPYTFPVNLAFNTEGYFGVSASESDFAHNPWMFPQTTVYRGEQYCDSGRPLASLETRMSGIARLLESGYALSDIKYEIDGTVRDRDKLKRNDAPPSNSIVHRKRKAVAMSDDSDVQTSIDSALQASQPTASCFKGLMPSEVPLSSNCAYRVSRVAELITNFVEPYVKKVVVRDKTIVISPNLAQVISLRSTQTRLCWIVSIIAEQNSLIQDIEREIDNMIGRRQPEETSNGDAQALQDKVFFEFQALKEVTRQIRLMAKSVGRCPPVSSAAEDLLKLEEGWIISFIKMVDDNLQDQERVVDATPSASAVVEVSSSLKDAVMEHIKSYLYRKSQKRAVDDDEVAMTKDSQKRAAKRLRNGIQTRILGIVSLVLQEGSDLQEIEAAIDAIVEGRKSITTQKDINIDLELEGLQGAIAKLKSVAHKKRTTVGTQLICECKKLGKRKRAPGANLKQSIRKMDSAKNN